ncbi:MAG: hypothetical protein ACHQDC_02395 [Acidimicrobiales bacterium]
MASSSSSPLPDPTDRSDLVDLLSVVPKLVDRSRAQLGIARSLAAHVPCIGRWFRSTETVPPPTDSVAEPIDVLSVLAEPTDAGDTRGGADPTEAPTAPDAGGTGVGPSEDPAVPTTTVPPESELAVPDYDSLAASQVVPRLAALSPADLDAVQRYELANRNRQTILNRISQLLTS